MDTKTIHKVEMGNYFSMPIVTIGSVVIFGAVAIFVLWLYDVIMFQTSHDTFSTILVNFLKTEFLQMIPLILIGSFLIFTTRFFEFDAEKKRIRNGGHFWKWDWGQWEDFQANGTYFAFQRYEQTNDIKFGSIFQKTVLEHIYELRMVYSDRTFKAIVNGSEFRCVVQIINVGKAMSETYQLPFYDYVKEIIKKQYMQ